MTRRDTLEAMLNRYGEPVQSGDKKASAILRPLRFGSSEEDLFLYTGPAGFPLCAGDGVSAGSRSFEVERAETVSLSGEALYVRAVLREIAAQTGETVTLETNGVTAATAERCTVRLSRDCKAAVSWGESNPFGAAQGVSAYEINLKNVKFLNNTLPENLTDFSVVVRHAGMKTTYSGCRVKAVEDSSGPGRAFRNSWSVLACSRAQDKEAVS